MINKKVVLFCTTLLVASALNAKTTICYKKAWEEPSTIEKTPLDGGECKGEKSLNQMQKEGWYIKDIEINSAEKGLDYNYILSDKNPVKLSKDQVSSNDVSKSLDTKMKLTRVKNVTQNSAKIDIGNLQVGQSGIIQHRYKDGNTIIVSSAYVESSNANSSTIKFIPFLDLKQNALPTTKRKVSENDVFILNYMYNQSLVITPNINSFRYVRGKFPSHNFMHSDVFAAHLKSNYRPLPSQKIIQDFAISESLGTIFLVIKNDLYIIDTRTFTILNKQKIANVSSESQMPFYTRVENIESSILTQDYMDYFNSIKDFFVDDRTEEQILYGDLATEKVEDIKTDYNSYYSNLLGLNND